MCRHKLTQTDVLQPKMPIYEFQMGKNYMSFNHAVFIQTDCSFKKSNSNVASCVVYHRIVSRLEKDGFCKSKDKTSNLCPGSKNVIMNLLRF